MKKFLGMLLLISMVLTLCCGCGGKEQEQQNIEPVISDKVIDFESIPMDDPIYDDIARGLPSIEKFIEYNHILGNTIDYTNVEAEDFWNIVAITVAAYQGIEEYASVDVSGVYHMKWNDMMNFANAFMFDSIFKSSTPSYNQSYAASADPGTGVIDLVPLGVDNYHVSLKGIEMAKKDSDYAYILHLAFDGGESDSYIHHYSVFLADWKYYIKKNYDRDDNSDHIFPYMIVGFNLDYSIDTDE